jgi:hypothetical protein
MRSGKRCGLKWLWLAEEALSFHMWGRTEENNEKLAIFSCSSKVKNTHFCIIFGCFLYYWNSLVM